MNNKNNLALLGYASGIAAGDPRCGEGPVILQQSADLIKLLSDKGWHATWEAMLYPAKELTVPAAVTALCVELADITKKLAEQRQFFTLFGGDHSCSIGTWSGVASAIKDQGSLGLLWFDAHMDSHTFETSPSGNIHGMPVASLLGYGAKELINILEASPKLSPEHVCLIGIRSFEDGEAELLRNLGVRIYFIEEVQARGLEAVVQEALAKVTVGITALGISIDLDGIDPQEAPGVGTPVPNGIVGADLLKALQLINKHPKFIGAEITEYNPYEDKNHITKNFIDQLLFALLPRRI